MKTRNFQIVILSIFISLILVSCNYLSDKKDNAGSAEAFKKEANYLSELSKENLNIIGICESLDTLKLQKDLQSTIKVIKQEQNQIQSNIKKLADDNIVLIANSADEKYKILDSLTEDVTQVKKALNFIQDKRERQLIILENLEEIEADNETHDIAKNLKETIKTNINITNKTLENLK